MTLLRVSRSVLLATPVVAVLAMWLALGDGHQDASVAEPPRVRAPSPASTAVECEPTVLLGQNAVDSVPDSCSLASAPTEASAPAQATTTAGATAAEIPVAGCLRVEVVDDLGARVLSPELILTRGDERLVLGPDRLEWLAGGAVRARVEPGTWSVAARSPEHEASDPVEVNVPQADEVATRVELTRHGILRGRVELPPEVARSLPQAFWFVLEASDDAIPTVEDMDDEPAVHVRRVQVWIGTDLHFELRDCVAGLYRIRLELPRPGGGWVSRWAQTWLDPGQDHDGLQLAFSTEILLALHGRVLDAGGQPVAGASVEAGPHQVTSDARGRFELRGLELGPHTLVVACDGKPRLEEDVEFVGDPLELQLCLLSPEDSVAQARR